MDTNVNLWLLAADKPAELIQFLRENPTKASDQDWTGYSLVHAAVSYNHLDLLRALIDEFHVNVDLKDQDGETALFVAETAECAKILVEDLHSDITIKGNSGQTARERISEEGEFAEVAVYLRMKELELQVKGERDGINHISPPTTPGGIHAPPPLPEGIQIDIGTMAPEDAGEVVDSEFRRRIEELAARDDFQEDSGQDELRQLITEAIRGGDLSTGERNVRPRMN